MAAKRFLPDGDYVVIPDLQAPYHDPRAVAAVQRFITEFQPDGLLCVGDESDQPEPSRWGKGLPGARAEYAGTYAEGLAVAYDVLKGFAAALHGTEDPDEWTTAKPFHIVRSNHTDRTEHYLRRQAPALFGTPWNEYPAIMGFGQAPLLSMLGTGQDHALPITWQPKGYEFAPGFMLYHGDEGSLSQAPGGTALGLARKVGASVVCGHTHRAGLAHATTAHSGKVTTDYIGLEVGHLMQLEGADYLKTGGANWRQGFGVLRIRGRRVYPELVLFHGRRFCVEGQVYQA